MKNSNLVRYLLYVACSISIYSCAKNDFSTDFDIPYPVPEITGLSTLKDTVGKIITITGKNLTKLSSVSVGTPSVQGTVVASTETSITFQLPRVFNAGPVTIVNQFKKTATSEASFTPVYLDVQVTGWPIKIIRKQPFVIQGINMDMITEVDVNGTKIPVTPLVTSPQNQLTVPTLDLTLPDKALVKVTKALGAIKNGNSPEIPVEDPADYFIPVAPSVLFDFEDGVDPYTAGDVATEHGINIGGLASAGRGTKYFTMKIANVPSAWNTYLGGLSRTNIDVSGFHQPYLSFLVNTNGKDGYFQLAVKQDGKKAGTDFVKAYTGVDADNYKFKTTGWEWRSVPLDITFNDWGQGGFKFDKNKLIQEIQLSFKQGNGANPFEIHLDQVMITDGKLDPVIPLFDFENGADPYSGTAAHGINLSGVPAISGARYLTVRKSGAGSWDWTGAMEKAGPIDLSNISNAYINFWMNTNGKKGFLQLETTQNNVKWGMSINTTDYAIQTNGWELISMRIADIAWSNWGGSGTATAVDAKGKLDYFKVRFSTGNITGEYEVNIDDVIISNGKLF